MVDDETARNVAALPSLYEDWSRGGAGRFGLVAGGALRARYDGASAVRDAVQALPAQIAHALVVSLWPREGWRHPVFAVDSYRRHGSADGGHPVAGSVLSDALARDFLLAASLRLDTPSTEDLSAPYVLVKDGAVLGRYRRVSQARQQIDAALPPLAPVVFTSLRPARAGRFNHMVLQALVETLR